jgi:hypothetical protein
MNPIAPPQPPSSFLPPQTTPQGVPQAVRQQGFAVLCAQDVCRWLGCSAQDLADMASHWTDMPPDRYLKDGGRYRRRRHGSMVVDATGVRPVPHRAHWQPLAYNALHGGMQRWFEPLPESLTALPVWQRLLQGLVAWADAMRGPQPWYVEAHTFRIDTTDGIGRPTPEGAHRDGVEFVAVFMVQRHGIKGGESRVFEADGPSGQRFTLMEPWSLLLLDDVRVIHESTPIQPEPADAMGWRDTLVLTLRRGGFQDESE